MGRGKEQREGRRMMWKEECISVDVERAISLILRSTLISKRNTMELSQVGLKRPRSVLEEDEDDLGKMIISN